MKCPSCSAVIDGSYVASFGSAKSVSCPACGFMLETGPHELFSTATEFKAVSGWTIRLAKGQEVHFESQAAFGQWLKETTVTPGDMICKDGTNWESLGTYLLGQRGAASRDSNAYQVPPNTLDAPDPEDEFEELDNAMETLDARAVTPRPVHLNQITSPSVPILATSVGHEKRIPPPIPGGGKPVSASKDSNVGLANDDETIATATEVEFSTGPKGVKKAPPSSASPRAVSPAQERQQSAKPNTASTQQYANSPKGNGGFGKLAIGLIIGALIASVAGIDLTALNESSSSAQRVVVTQQVPELSLKDKELVETSQRWLSYLSLTSTTALQLKSRLEQSKETTEQGRAQRQALIVAAYAFDLHRTQNTNERKQILTTYDEYIVLANTGTATNALRLLKTLSGDAKPVLKSKPLVDDTAASIKVGDKSEKKDTLSQPKGVDNGQTATADQSTAAQTPAHRPIKPIDKAEPVSETKSSAKIAKASYSKMLKAGTRHLENGRLKDASIALKKAAGLKPKAHAPQFKLGYVALNRGQLAQALRYFKRAKDLKPRDRETLLGLGSVYEKMGRRDDARRIYERYQSYFKGANDRRRIEYKLEKLGR
jgi:tetratricopeptide (TPR) repeat protein